MQKRGGGILDIILKTKPICCLIIFSYMPLLRPKTAWAPISSIRVWNNFKTLKQKHTIIRCSRNGKEIEVVMSILSNYVPNCIVEQKYHVQ
jgi:hydroxymethylglutaryl-CoA reductase